MTGLSSSSSSHLSPLFISALLLLCPLAVRCDPSAYSVSLLGAASFCTASLMQQLSLGYHLTNPLFSLDIVETASQVAIDSFLGQSADFAMVSNTMSSEAITLHPTAVQLPFVALPIALIYNIPTIPSLTFSGLTLTHVMLGDIVWWNDSAIAADNPGTALPNATIHVVVQIGGYMTNFVLLTVLGQYYPPILTLIPPSLYPSWPTSRYASFSVADQLDGASALTLLHPLSIGYSVYGQAVANAAQLAALYNTDGVAVSISPAAIQQAVDYNAVVQVQLYSDAATNPDVVLSLESVTHIAWPLVGLQYVLVDAAYARTTCTAKGMMADFLIWVYQSDSATATFTANGVLLLPSVVESAIGIIRRLQTSIMCRGAPVIAADASTTVDVSADGRLLPLLSLLSAEFNFAHSSQLLLDGTSYDVVQQSNPSALVIDQMRFDEVDVGLFFADDISPPLLSALVASQQFTIAPLFFVMVGSHVNPQIHPSIFLDETPLNLSLPLFGAIYGFAITDWTHPAILALNPYLASQFAALPPPVSAPITVVFPCTTGSIGAYASGVIHRLIPQAAVVAIGQSSCPSPPLINGSEQFVATEAVLEAAADVVIGSMSYEQFHTFDTIGMVALVLDDGSVNTPSPDNLLACADAIDPTTLLIDVSSSTNPACQPFTQVVYAILPNQYPPGSDCDTGSFAYQLFTETWNNSDKDAVFEAMGYVRAARSPAVLELINATLPQVVCGGSSLLVKLPTAWELSSSVSAFARAMAVIGLVIGAWFGVVMMVKRRHPAMQGGAGGGWGMAVVLAGVAVSLLTVIAWAQQPVSDATCGAVLWGMNLAPSLILGPLYARVYRWHRLYGVGRSKAAHRPSPLLLRIATVAPFALSLLFVALWQGLSPLIPQTTGGYIGSQPWAYLQCGFDPADADTTRGFLVAAGFLQGGQLLVFSLLAFSVRRLMVAYNDNARVAYTLYNTAFALLLLIPIMEVVGAIGDLLVLLVTLLLLWVAFAPLLLLFVPLTLHAFARSSTVPVDVAVSSAASLSLGFTFLDIGAMTEEVLEGYIAALEGQVEEVRRKVIDVGGKGERGAMGDGEEDDRTPLDKAEGGGGGRGRKSSMSELSSTTPISSERGAARNVGPGLSSRAAGQH